MRLEPICTLLVGTVDGWTSSDCDPSMLKYWPLSRSTLDRHDTDAFIQSNSQVRNTHHAISGQPTLLPELQLPHVEKCRMRTCWWGNKSEPEPAYIPLLGLSQILNPYYWGCCSAGSLRHEDKLPPEIQVPSCQQVILNTSNETVGTGVCFRKLTSFLYFVLVNLLQNNFPLGIIKIFESWIIHQVHKTNWVCCT